jgi:hypothetical protein
MQFFVLFDIQFTPNSIRQKCQNGYAKVEYNFYFMEICVNQSDHIFHVLNFHFWGTIINVFLLLVILQSNYSLTIENTDIFDPPFNGKITRSNKPE